MKSNTKEKGIPLQVERAKKIVFYDKFIRKCASTLEGNYTSSYGLPFHS